MDEVANEASTGVIASDMNRLRCEAGSFVTRVLTRALAGAAVFWNDSVDAMVIWAISESTDKQRGNCQAETV